MNAHQLAARTSAPDFASHRGRTVGDRVLVMASRIGPKPTASARRRGGTSRPKRDGDRRLLGVRQIVQIACNGAPT
jgi:hypothetical protein